MTTHILLNSPKECQNIVEILEDELYDDDYPLNIKSIHDNPLAKYYQINKQ